MDRTAIKAALEDGVPFALTTADGRRFQVPHRDYSSFSPKGTFVTVYDDNEHMHVLPLLTLTSLDHQPKPIE